MQFQRGPESTSRGMRDSSLKKLLLSTRASPPPKTAHLHPHSREVSLHLHKRAPNTLEISLAREGRDRLHPFHGLGVAPLRISLRTNRAWMLVDVDPAFIAIDLQRDQQLAPEAVGARPRHKDILADRQDPQMLHPALRKSAKPANEDWRLLLVLLLLLTRDGEAVVVIATIHWHRLAAELLRCTAECRRASSLQNVLRLHVVHLRLRQSEPVDVVADFRRYVEESRHLQRCGFECWSLVLVRCWICCLESSEGEREASF